MNDHFQKHRWRIGIMTEMAPVGYVGVSPKCILGFNKVKSSSKRMKIHLLVSLFYFLLSFWFVLSLLTPVLALQNHGEEISLRLRTDDLKGFRKYESIKKTLLHELVSFIIKFVFSSSFEIIVIELIFFVLIFISGSHAVLRTRCELLCFG